MTNNIIDQPINFNPEPSFSFALGGDSLATTTLVINDGYGQYTINQLPGLTGSRGDVAFGDLNGDGLDDLFSHRGFSPDDVSLNDGNGVFVSTGQVLDSGFFPAFNVELADIDSDGDLDGLTATRSGGIRLWENDGAGSFNDVPIFGTERALDIAIADFDGNGVKDIVSAHFELYSSSNGGTFIGDAGIHFLHNYGTTGATTETFLPSEFSNMIGVDVADFDGDGDLDVFGTATGNGSISNPHMLLLNDGFGNFSIGAQFVSTNKTGVWDSTHGDFDGDGDTDMVVSYGPFGLEFFLNDGAGNFTSRLETTSETANGLFAGDLDGDGSDEIVVGSFNYLKGFSLEASGLSEEFSVDTISQTYRVEGILIDPTEALTAQEDGGYVNVTLTDFVDLTDPDLDSSALTFEITTGPEQGTAQIINDELIYDPGGAFQHLGDGETAEVTCEITLTDGAGVTYTDTITITVTGSAEYCVHTGGGEFLVNTQTLEDQIQPSIAGLANGGTVIVWETSDTPQDGSQAAVKAKILNADNSVAVPEFFVNLGPMEGQSYPEVAALANGGFAVTWTAVNTSGDSFIIGRVFDDTGGSVRFDFSIADQLDGIQTFAEVTALDNGGFVVVWQTNDPAQDGDGDAIKARVFDAAGMPIASEFLVNSTTVSDQTQAHVTSLNNGSFVVAWTSNAPGVGQNIHAQIFNAAGVAQGSELSLNSANINNQNAPSIAGLPNGGFVATWQTDDPSYGGFGGDVIAARLFDVSGAPLGDEFAVNSAVSGLIYAPEVTALNDGDFVITWSGAGADFEDVAVRHFGSDGTPLGAEFIANDQTNGGQNFSDITTLADGGFAVTWQTDDFDQDGSGSAIKAVTFAPSYASIVDVEISTPSISENQIGNLPCATFEGIGIEGALYTYTLVSDPSGAFAIVDDALIVSDNSKLDFETSPSLSIIVRATDDAGNSFDKTIDLAITDAPEEARVSAGSEFLVNTETDDIQKAPDLAALSDGRFVATWWTFDSNADGDLSAIKAQIFDPTGAKDGPEFLVNTQATDSQGSPTAAGLSDGGFVVAWRTWDTAQDGDGNAIKAQIFDANGQPQGSEFLVNTTASNSQVTPHVTALPSGGFVVSWDSDITHYSELNAQVFDATGMPVGNEIVANVPDGNLENGEITTLANGNFVIAWQQSFPSGFPVSVGGLKAQIFDSSGATVGDIFSIKDHFPDAPYDPTITALKGGGFVAAWTGFDGIYGQLFDATGTALGGEIFLSDEVLPEDISKLDQSPVITGLNTGGFVLAWQELGFPSADGSGSAIKARTFDATGAATSEVYVVNEEANFEQLAPTITGLENGGFVVSWETQDGAQDGSFEAIKARVFEPVSLPSPVDLYSDDSFSTLLDTYNSIEVALTAALPGQALDFRDESLAGEIGVQIVSVDDLTVRGDASLTGEFQLAAGVLGFTLIGSNEVKVVGNDQNNVIGGAEGNNVLSAGAGNDTVSGGLGDDQIEGGSGEDILRGLSGADTISGGLDADILRGDSGDDVLIGEDGDDLITGGSGDDEIDGGTGDDHLFGQGGSDTINGGSNGDTIFAGSGNDTVYGGSGNDEILGQGSADLLMGEDGFDTLRGGSGDDTIDGGANNDQIFGNGNNDLLIGGSGNDTMQGAGGLDTLEGGSGDDVLTGGVGVDSLDGGTGDDVLNGGANADRFVFANDYDEDRINSYQQGSDRIELDDALWAGTPGISDGQDVVDTFGTSNGTGSILTLDFGGGDVLEIQSAGGINAATLGDDILIF